MADEFWKRKSLAEMSRTEWESLCDGCGKCCLHKLQDEDSGAILYTQVACRYLDDDCRCKAYQQRIELVPDCVQLKALSQGLFQWLPQTCAYRLLAEGKPLADWHPLVSGDKTSVHTAGASVQGQVLSEEFVHPDDIEQQVIHWVS